MDRIRIGYFLEDRAHELYLNALVERVAQEVVPNIVVEHDVRSGRGGRAIKAYKVFLRDLAKGRQSPFDLLVVAVDGNCERFSDRIKKLREYAQRVGYPGIDRITFAIPDPHIERSYLIDPQAFAKALGASDEPKMPPYKCKKGMYKEAINSAFKQANVRPLLGGPEYAEKIVKSIDLYKAGQANSGFASFVDDLKTSLRP